MEIIKDSSITTREKEVVYLLAKGFTCPKIADMLYISVNTVITHRNNIKRKLKVRNTCNLIYCACKERII